MSKIREVTNHPATQATGAGAGILAIVIVLIQAGILGGDSSHADDRVMDNKRSIEAIEQSVKDTMLNQRELQVRVANIEKLQEQTARLQAEAAKQQTEMLRAQTSLLNALEALSK